MTLPNRRVLIVEDDEVERLGLATFLERQGYEVHTAADGQKALDLLRDQLDPGVILLDMCLPVADGWQFLASLAKIAMEPAPKIVLTTGTEAIGADWARAHGCAGFLPKPLNLDALVEVLRQCFGQAGQLSESQASQ